MNNQEIRWVQPDWESTIKWCKKRNHQSIRCVIDVLGENSKDEEEVGKYLQDYKTVIDSIADEKLKAAPSIKLTSLGANFDRDLCKEFVAELFTKASLNKVQFEMDMEGTPLVDFTLNSAENGIKVRLVKGAYLGDVDMFSFIQERFKFLFIILMDSKYPFSVGTHDLKLIEWIKGMMANKKEQIEFGFLMGLADKTKIELVEDGWNVSEYIPFGSEKIAYETRRNRYLMELEKAGRLPAP
jgi:proline dehydrogenase